MGKIAKFYAKASARADLGKNATVYVIETRRNFERAAFLANDDGEEMTCIIPWHYAGTWAPSTKKRFLTDRERVAARNGGGR